MNPDLSIKLENKVSIVQECNMSIQKKGLSEADKNYTLKMHSHYLSEIKILIERHPELAQHPALFKIESSLN